MPYELRKDGPKDKPFCIYNTETDDKKGCSKTEKMAKAFMRKLYLEEGKKEMNIWSDDAFLFVEKGEKDEEGKTTPRSLRHFPYKNAEGEIDLPYLRKMLDDPLHIDDNPIEEDLKQRIQAKAKRLLSQSLSKKELSLDEQITGIRNAFYDTFPSEPAQTVYPINVYVRDVFDTYVIVSGGDQMFKVSYKSKDDGVEFASRDKWKKVEMAYVVKKEMPTLEDLEIEQKTLTDKIKTLWDKVFPIKQNPSFFIKELDNGQFRWVGISSTAFFDDEEEIISMKALANIEPLGEGDYGPLQFWHVPLKLGTCDFQAADGVCLVESGLWNDDKVSVAVRKAIEKAPRKYKFSIGFVPTEKPVENVSINGVVVKRIWDGIQTKERSILPAKYAANKFTCIVTEGGITVDKEKEKVLREILGDELATQTIEQITALNEKAESKDAVVKDVKPEPEPVPEPEEKETPKPEISKDELTAVLKELQTLPERFKKLEGDIQKLKEDLAPRSALEQARASEAKDNLATEKEVEKAGPSDSGVISQMVDAFIGA